MRGAKSEPGTTRTSANGYHYTCTVDDGWRLTHHIIAEEKLGRPLRENERVVFGKKGKTCLDPDNIDVFPVGKTSVRRKIAALDARIEELQKQRELLLEEIKEELA